MSEAQNRTAQARQFVERWSHEKWTNHQIDVLALAIVYGEGAGFEAAADMANETFGNLTAALKTLKIKQ